MRAAQDAMYRIYNQDDIERETSTLRERRISNSRNGSSSSLEDKEFCRILVCPLEIEYLVGYQLPDRQRGPSPAPRRRRSLSALSSQFPAPGPLEPEEGPFAGSPFSPMGLTRDWIFILSTGRRVYRCGVPICSNCNFTFNNENCPFCESFVTSN